MQRIDPPRQVVAENHKNSHHQFTAISPMEPIAMAAEDVEVKTTELKSSSASIEQETEIVDASRVSCRSQSIGDEQLESCEKSDGQHSENDADVVVIDSKACADFSQIHSQSRCEAQSDSGATFEVHKTASTMEEEPRCSSAEGVLEPYDEVFFEEGNVDDHEDEFQPRKELSDITKQKLSALKGGERFLALVGGKHVSYSAMQTAIHETHAKCGCVYDAHEVFDERFDRDIVTRTTGDTENELKGKKVTLLDELPIAMGTHYDFPDDYLLEPYEVLESVNFSCEELISWISEILVSIIVIDPGGVNCTEYPTMYMLCECNLATICGHSGSVVVNQDTKWECIIDAREVFDDLSKLDVLEGTTRCWLQEKENHLITNDVTSNPFYQYSEDKFSKSWKGYLKDVGSVLELYKASQIMIHPGEEVLVRLNDWRRHFLKHELFNYLVQDGKFWSHVEQEVNDVLKFSYLERLTSRKSMDHCNVQDTRILRTSHGTFNLANQDSLKWAVEDFNICQPAFKQLSRWIVKSRLDKLQGSRQKLAYCTFPNFLMLAYHGSKDGVLAYHDEVVDGDVQSMSYVPKCIMESRKIKAEQLWELNTSVKLKGGCIIEWLKKFKELHDELTFCNGIIVLNKMEVQNKRYIMRNWHGRYKEIMGILKGLSKLIPLAFSLTKPMELTGLAMISEIAKNIVSYKEMEFPFDPGGRRGYSLISQRYPLLILCLVTSLSFLLNNPPF